MSTPMEIRTRLASSLGSSGLPYWRSLADFLQGKIGRIEFDENVRQWINTPSLAALHNALLVSILMTASMPPATNPALAPPTGPPRKKRRLLPHQDPPPALDRWILGLGKSERNRIRTSAHAKNVNPTPPIQRNDEIITERPIRTVMEGKYRPGTHVPLPLSTVTRTLPTTQHLVDRMVLIAAQHSMTASKPAASLLSAAVEAYLKQITMHALASSSSSHPFTSITPSNRSAKPSVSLSSFKTLFTLAPFENPTTSASVMNLAMLEAGNDDEEEEEELVPRGAWEQYDAATRQSLMVMLSGSGMRAVVKSGFKLNGIKI